MNKSNPFNRSGKTENINYSVFPAHKTTRTSMRIGEVVPVYSIEMAQGNHIELSVSQLSRFMTMDKPVMNDFEVTYVAGFVPWRALNAVGGHGIKSAEWINGAFPTTGLSVISSKALDYELYFNPSTPDSWRQTHFPLRLTSDNVYLGTAVGSLWDHLGYAMPFDTLNHCFYESLKDNADGSVSFTGFYPTASFSDFFTKPSILISGGNLTYNYMGIAAKEIVSDFTDNDVDHYLMPLDIWAILNPQFDNTILTYASNIRTNGILPYVSHTKVNGVVSAFEAAIGTTWAAFSTAGKDYITRRFNDWLKVLAGSMDVYTFTNGAVKKLSDLFMAYRSACIGHLMSTKYFGVTPTTRGQSCLDLLTYLRFYGDVFLHPNFTNKQNWLECVGAAYISFALAGSTSSFADRLITYWGNYLGSSSSVWANALKNGRCFPVLWQTDYFTALLPSDVSSNQGVTIVSGDSIPTLFYKRQWFKFKNMIARLGNDYETNSKAMYGSNPVVAMDRTNIVGIRRFSVNMSAIAQSAPSNGIMDESTVGDFIGYGYSNDKAGGFSWTANEFGTFMVLAFVRPKGIAYTDSIKAYTIKNSYSDFLNPQLAGVGYVDMIGYELCGSTKSNVSIGKVERYWDYMYVNNEVSGSFRTIARPYSVDREIGSLPLLNNFATADIDFLYITDKDDVHRIFTDTLNDPIIAQIHFEGSVTRQLPAVIRTDF